MFKFLRKQESGRSMIEMVGVLAVAGLLTAGAFVLVKSGMASQKRNRAADEISTLAQGVRSFAAAHLATTGYFGFLPWISNSGVPTKTVGGESDYMTPYEMARVLLKTEATTPLGDGSYYAISGEGNGFAIWLVGIESEECEAMAVRTYSDGTATCSTISNKKVLKITYSK